MSAFILSTVLAFSGQPHAERIKDAPRFPFPVEVDEKSGKTGTLPNRIRKKETGMWFALVPAGKYRIGSDKVSDSKPIDVALKAFYIAESRVANSHVAQVLETEFRAANDIAKGYVPLAENQFTLLLSGKGTLPKKLRDLPADRREDQLWLANVFWIWWDEIMLAKGELDFLAPEKRKMSLGVSKALETKMLQWSSALPEPKKEDNGTPPSFEFFDLLAHAMRDVRLTARQKKEAREICLEFEKEFLQQLEVLRKRGKETYVPFGFGDAQVLAKHFKLELPTEAQWEAAARLRSKKKIDLEAMLDGVLEWCADYYAYDYFQRKKDFEDPKGPPRGRLNAEQRAAYSSSLGILSPWRSFHVLRGGDASRRYFGYYADLLPQRKAVRLAFAAEERK